MLGAIVYRLRAKETARLSLSHGRLMHAAFFALLQSLDPELSSLIHNTQTLKPFTVSDLTLLQHLPQRDRTSFLVPADRTLAWRVTALKEDLIDCLLSLSPGYILRAGQLPLEVISCCMSPDEHPESGILSEENLIAACLSIPRIQEISFSFRSPVSFRYFNQDYPWPLPEYIFGSLADKWNLSDMPFAIDRQEIQGIAQGLIPGKWQGMSRRVYLKDDRGVLAFEGEFSYRTDHLPPEHQQLLLALAQFSVFSGIGRLTGHGLGQTRVTYR